jgi:anti-sigma-K factor RskA
MRYDQPELSSRLAADYLFGLMPALARGRFERVIAKNATLAAKVAGWSEQLAPLDGVTEDIAPPPHVWRAIERRIGLSAKPAALQQRRLRFSWRIFAVSAIAASAAIVLYIAFNPVPVSTTVEAVAEKIGLPGWMEAARRAPADISLSTMRLGISERERPRWIRAALLLTSDAQPITAAPLH